MANHPPDRRNFPMENEQNNSGTYVKHARTSVYKLQGTENTVQCDSCEIWYHWCFVD